MRHLAPDYDDADLDSGPETLTQILLCRHHCGHFTKFGPGEGSAAEVHRSVHEMFSCPRRPLREMPLRYRQIAVLDPI